MTALKERPKLRDTMLKLNFEHGLEGSNVDREERVIRNVQIIRAGEAKGHGMQIEPSFVQDIVRAGNKQKLGVKSRFEHPSMSNPTLGTELGRFRHFRYDEDKQAAYADLHFGSYAEKSPRGDLVDWTMTFAEEDPAMFGNSIVFQAARFYQYGEDGEKRYYANQFDADEDQPVYPELGQFFASDIVDTPAATDGLFSQQINDHAFAQRINVWLDQNPDVDAFLDIYPDVEAKISELIESRREIKAARDKHNIPTPNVDMTAEEIQSTLGAITEPLKAQIEELQSKIATIAPAQRPEVQPADKVAELQAKIEELAAKIPGEDKLQEIAETAYAKGAGTIASRFGAPAGDAPKNESEGKDGRHEPVVETFAQAREILLGEGLRGSDLIAAMRSRFPAAYKQSRRPLYAKPVED